MPVQRASSRTYTSADGLIARAGRAHEDPAAMTAPATMARMGRYVYRVLRQNPDLTEKQAINAATLQLRADMAKLARKSARARGAVVGVIGLEDGGSDGADAA